MSLFTPYSGLLGGSLIGSSAALLLITNGDIMGASGIMSTMLNPRKCIENESERWKGVFLGSFVLTAMLYTSILSDANQDARLLASEQIPVASKLAHAIGGLLVGLGTKIGNGCTTGHGICGISRFSKRSFAAVCTFTACGMTTASLISPTSDRANYTALLRTDVVPDTSGNLSFAVAAAFVGLALSFGFKRSTKQPDMQRKVYGACVSGSMFAIGLAISGMTKKSKVQGFLDVSALVRPDGEFDPTLITVLGSGILMNFLAYQFVTMRKRQKETFRPVCGGVWSIPTNKVIDKMLLLGSALFGVGWGLVGLCPGPALFSAAVGVPDVVAIWFPSFFAGSYIGADLKRRHSSSLKSE